ncbi:KR domain-containing protein [Rhypophila decipiens]|uniref:KR domain-containing protein n=1 Tax=Rhypophila decipiens TaxID=261697 RepID=A0AAN6Y875_9PEZI|nr:KR domain-containing protein [Rhypophila decipiens]
MMIGLLRPAPRQLPTLDLQFLDFVNENRVDARVIAETLLRLRLTTRWQRDAVLEVGSAQLTSIALYSLAETVLDWVTTSPVSVQIMPVESHIFLSSHKTYWLTGLSHGLGLSLCEWLFRRGARHIAISSRRPSIPNTWLAGMANAGVSVRAFPCDLTDQQAVRNTHASICSSMPPVGGVALGAMVLDDVSLPEMTLDQLKRVTAPKVQGSLHLHSLFGQGATGFPLDFFVMFSSASSVVGYAGQGNYAAANLFMSALAEHRRRQGLASSVIHIGPVLGVGYVTEKNRERDLRRQVDAGEGMFLSEQDFHRLFAEAVFAGRPVSGQGSGRSASIEVTTGIPRIGIGQEDKPMWASNPVLGHFLRNDVGDGNGVDDRDGGLEVVIPLKTRLRQASSWDEIYNAILGGFLSRISALYRLPVEQLAKEDPATLRLSEMGTDSLLATEIRAWFLKTLQVNIPVLKVLSGSTMMELVTTATQTIPAAWIPLINVDDYKPSAQSRLRISTPAVAICPPVPTITKTALAQQPREEDESDSQSISDGEGCDRHSTPTDGSEKDDTAPSSAVSEFGSGSRRHLSPSPPPRPRAPLPRPPSQPTPFHFYLGVMRVLLARHTAAAMQGRDVAIGIADANRVEQEDREVMGPLVNLLPLRFEAVDKGASFEDTLKDTRQKVLRALSHAKVPFQVLLNE